MFFCCTTGNCSACKTERRLAGAAVVALLAFTVADNSNPDLHLIPPLGDALAATSAGAVAGKFSDRLDGPRPAVTATAAPAATQPKSVAPLTTGSIQLRSSVK